MPTKSRQDFHESYYEHSCAIIGEKDVLETDIRGRTYRARLRRWWHGLFLLSYSDQRNRTFYTSSQAMRMERTRHFRKFRGRIHPLSEFRSFWDWLMLSLFLVNNIVFNHNMSFLYGQIYFGFYYLSAFIEVIIIIDVILNMKTGYVDYETRKIVLDKYDGLLHYCSRKLFLHVASAIPLQWIMFLRFGSDIDCALCKTNKFMAAIKVINIFRLFRIYETSSYWTRPRTSYKTSFFFKIVRISTLGLFTMLQFLDLADHYTLQCMIDDGKIDDESYLSLLIWMKYVYKNPFSDYTLLVYNFSRICKSTLLFGFSYRRATYYLDITSALCGFLIMNLFYFWMVIECYSFIYCMSFSKDKVINIKNAMDSTVRCRQLDDKTTRKLKKYYNFHQSKVKAIERYSCLYKSLPNVLKKEIALASYTRYIRRIPYFSDWPTNVIDAMVLMLREEIYLSHDLVAEPWVQSEGLMIVAMGELAVYSKDEETGHLIDGDYFGELSLVTNREVRSSSVVAITSSTILLLEKGDFRTFMRQYFDLFYALKNELKGKYKKSVKTPTIG